MYDKWTQGGASEVLFDQCEKAEKIAANAIALAIAMEENIFGGPAKQVIQPVVADFEELPKLLRVFAGQLKRPLMAMGKPGHKSKAAANRFLILASEFVFAKTGK